MAERLNPRSGNTLPKERPLIWLQGLLCGALVTIAPPTALLLGVLMAPAVLAVLLTRQPGHPIVRSVALCGMAASVQPLRTLWLSGHSTAIAMALVADARVLALAWSAAAGGWLLAEIVPVAIRVVLDAISLSRAAQLRAARARLVATWGIGSAADQ